MKIIIIGDGKVGYSLAENLSNEDNDVVVIDKDPEALRKANEYLDVMCIKGNGLSTKVLIEAGVKEAQLLIAATASDEINMVCCLTAKKLGVERTIARIRDPEYADELNLLKDDLGLDMVFNPERAAAREISRMVRFPQAANIEIFARGRVEIVEIRISKGISIVGMKIREIAEKISSTILIGAVVRNDEIIIPNGDFRIEEDDILHIVGKPAIVSSFCRQIGIDNQKIKNVMIAGGGRIAYYLAKFLEETGIKAKIVEINEERCVELSELLPHTLIINGDGTDDTLLHSENLSEMGAFVALTDMDEENFMSALMAKQAGVQKVIAKINRNNYIGIIKSLGIESVINPSQIITNHILRYVRGMKNAQGSPIEALFRIIDGRAEAIEFTANESTDFLNIPLRDLKFKEGILVAVIVRKNDILIPHGNDMIKAGDSVILIVRGRKISDLNDIIASR
ncbi:MAG TPA: Trk system potassium transporter TrkA [Ruminiclostridium sp.]|jgi:trk system potassium uptake protein TrkA|nr:Trk system potassium transporter TrkA [Clostridiaceae bacterium]HAA25849.1 Trk system potassium transporter TrkA [Ruminiclostridium sp.]